MVFHWSQPCLSNYLSINEVRIVEFLSFPKGASVMWNTSSFQDFNSSSLDKTIAVTLLTPLCTASLSKSPLHVNWTEEYTDCTSTESKTPASTSPPNGCEWQPVMLEEGIQVAEKSVIRKPKQSRDLQTRYFGFYCAQRTVGKARSDELAGHVRPLH